MTRDMMKTYMTKIFTVALLMMVSMGAKAEVEVKIESFTGGKITASQGDEKNGEVEVTLTVAPDDGYTITKKDIEVYATISPNGTRADNPEVSGKLELKGDDPKDLSEKRDYTVTVKSNFGVWVKKAEFISGSKGNRGGVITITTDTNENGTIEDNEKILYLIQSNQFESFYMVPTSNGANATTNNIPNAQMLWYFLDAGTEGTTQYYYIVSNSTNKYICHGGGTANNSTSRGVTLVEKDASNEERCKFKLVEDNSNGTVGFYNIDVKGSPSYYGLNKQGGSSNYSNPVRLTNATYIHDPSSKWKFIPYNGSFTWPAPPFTPSTNSQNYYYKIHNKTNESYYVSSDAASPKNVTISSTESDNMVWYFKEASTDSWIKYYYIVNPVDGEYMYYNGTATDGNDQSNAIVQKEKTSENEDRFQFIIVQTARVVKINNVDTPVEGCYTIIPKLLKDQYWSSNSISPTSISEGNKLGIRNGRGSDTNNAHWEFESTVYPSSCSTPTITYSSETGKITITSTPADAEIHYTTDGETEPSSSVGTLYSVPFEVSSSVTIKAIATKTGYDPSTVETVSFIQVATPTIQRNSSNVISISSTTGGVTIYYTTDGSTPTTSSTEYTEAFENHVSGVTIKAIAVKDGMINSAIGEETFTLNCATPTISFNSATSQVTISGQTGTTIYYTTDGSTPTTSSTAYSVPFTVSSGATIKAIAIQAGYSPSTVAELAITQVAMPSIQNNGSNAVSITCDTEGATIYYTTDGSTPTTSSTEYIEPLTENVSGVTINAIAVKENMIPSAVGSGSVTLQCESPVIVRSGNNGFTVSCPFPTSGVTIYYTTDGSTPTTSSGSVASGGTVTVEQLPITVMAMAVATNYDNSTVTTTTVTQGMGGDGSAANPYTIEYQGDVVDFITTANTVDGASMYYKVIATSPLDFSGASAITQSFSGTFDGGLQTISGLDHALFNTIDGGTVKNVILDNVGISSGTNVGAVCNEATGTTRIYNCGVLSTPQYDINGNLTGFSGSSVGGSGNVGGLVGTLSGSARVINCFSYATITGGSNVGGIVGYNSVASSQTNVETMVMNCMFYGDITGGSTVSPVYGGENIDNRSGGLATYNYYSYSQLKTQDISDGKYNCTLAMEERFLNRCEIYRQLLNSNKKLAAIYATGSADNAEQMAKWVLETADRQISNPMPYPVLRKRELNKKYPSIINYDATHAPDSTSAGRNRGGKVSTNNGSLAVTIYKKNQKTDGGQSWPTADASDVQTTSLQLIRTDKDTTRYNFNYDKVQLPYYNDVGTGNYTENRVVTGWKIVSVSGGTQGTFSETDAWGGYNFADRKCTDKDVYGVSGRVFSQGAYYDVPYGVTGITIEPYWGVAAYVSDQYYDVVYSEVANKDNNYTSEHVTGLGTQNTNNTNITINGSSQKVFTSIGDARTSLSINTSKTVYDYAVVLVGNVHQAGPLYGSNSTHTNTPYTIMSVDLDKDNEPDYSFIFSHYNRQGVTPIRFDFLNVPGTAQAQKPNGATQLLNVSIFNPKGWFEVTNTCNIYITQFEADNEGKTAAPVIFLGGVIDQYTSTKDKNISKNDYNHRTQYIHLGSNACFKEFGNGTHSDGWYFTNHVPVSVTGGDFDGFYLSGVYRPDAQIQADDAEGYISGGRFKEMAGAAQQMIAGDVRFQIYDADITNFFGGGINAEKPITGNITVDIFNSHVGTYCGGPKFGDMQKDGTTFITKYSKNKAGTDVGTYEKSITADGIVITNATGCTFDKFFGAGYGGASSYKLKYFDAASSNNFNLINNTAGFNKLINNYNNDRGKYYDGNTNTYKTDFGNKGPGVATDFDYEFFVWSSGAIGARFYVNYTTFSLAQTNNVNSTLTNCIINENFYGGGSYGKVDGTATSELIGCTVKGDVFGGGYSASIPSVPVRATGFAEIPYFNANSGIFEMGNKNGTTDFQWKEGSLPANAADALVNGEIPTDVDLDALGQVGNTDLTISGTTTVDGSVYGGGEESGVNGNTEVNVTGGTVYGSVYGGGNLGSVGTYTVSDDMRDFTWKDTDGNDNSTGNEKNTGVCKVTITDGTVGANVFGAGKGKGDTFWCEKGIVYSTDVSISNGTVNGNVYGGGEVGRVETNAVVTIGTENATGDTAPTITGSVFGAGAGLYTHGYSALVRGNTTVTVQGTGQVGGSVYGGGEIASVGRFTVVGGLPKHPDSGGECTITIQDKAKIGTSGTNHNVYGACKGVDPDTVQVRRSMQTFANRPKDASGHYKDEHDGWEYYAPNHDFVWVEYTADDYPAFLKTLALTSHPHVTIAEDATVYGSVFGGGQRGITLGRVDVDITGGTIEDDVYGGGALADTNCGNWDADSYTEVTGLTAGVSSVAGLYTRTGSGTTESPYVYTATTGDNPTAVDGTTYYSKGKWHDTTKTAYYTTTVDLTGGLVKGDAYGGGLGQKTGFDSATSDIAAVVWGDIAVNLGSSASGSSATSFDIANYTDSGYTDVVKSGRVFGCNNLLGSPQGNVSVTVYKTVSLDSNGAIKAKPTKKTDTYELAAVYGGGNLAPYTTEGMKTHVEIHGCSDTSIQTVYGGGNAAAVPETDVNVYSSYEIGALFGGGNGKDKYKNDAGWQTNPGANVNGDVNTLIYGGTVYEAYGASNEKGTITGNVSIDVSETNPEGCTLVNEKIVGAGRNADIDGNLIVVMGCKPSTKIPLYYGGADNANVNGNVELTITSGNFGKVFGGNNEGGAIRGHIFVNIEETGDCTTPITIDELYLGGNNAAYSRFGYYIKTSTENGVGAPGETPDLTEGRLTFMPRTSADDPHLVVKTYNREDNSWTVYPQTGESAFTPYDEPELNVVSCTSIGEVYGGGYGTGGTMYANPTVNINMIPGHFANDNTVGVPAVMTANALNASDNPQNLGIIGDVFGGGNAADVIGNPTVNIGTASKVKLHLSYDKTKIDGTHDGYEYSGDQDVLGAYITGNVFGGGKGSAENYECDKAMVGKNNDGAGAVPGSNDNKDKGTKVNIANGTVNGDVYGGGQLGRVEWNTQVTIGIKDDTNESPRPVISGSVFGAGAGVETHGYSALVRGNSTVTVQGKAKVLQNVYGGGEKATVGRYWVKGINNKDAGGNVIEEAKPVPDNLPDGMPYKQQSGGICTVIIQDNAQIGPDNGGTKTAGHVFGAGKGVLPQFNANTSKKMTKDDGLVTFTDGNGKTAEDAYLEFLQTLALVTYSYVTIDGSAIVKGSVYGGSESGYVQHDTNVTVSGGTIGTTDLGGAYFGNVYGGGKGDAEYTGSQHNYLAAGIVKGSTKVKIEDGTILHNIYGGGAYGSVGVFDYGTDGLPTALDANAPENSGKTEIEITGGTIGTTGDENGMVFGSSRGDVGYDYTNNIDPNDRLAWVYSTKVEIGNSGQGATLTTPQIYGSVYGSGENGHTWQNTVIDIYSGTIGTVSKEDKYKLTADGVTYTGADYPYRGNVYGGGCGTDKYASTEGGSKNTYNPLAGIVRGTTTVNISGGQVAHNVYGAGAMGSVGGSTDEGAGKTTINITGGRIGDDGVDDGNIYGAARGDTDYTGANSANLAQVRETDVNINYATTVTSDNEGHTAQLITGSVFGGGEAGIVTGDVAVDVTGGLVLHDVYGGGALANSNTANWNPIANNGVGGWATAYYTAPTESTPAVTEYKTNVTLKGGMINGNVYGGGLGRKYQPAVAYQEAQGTYGQDDYVPEVEAQEAIIGIPAKVYGDVTVKLNETTGTDDCVVKGSIFGCNNLNGSPQNQVSVYVYKTQGWEGHERTVLGKLDSQTESDHVYDVEAVYGGGNLAAYEPFNARKEASETEKAQTYAKVEVYGCDLTSIRQVYGGGNAASSPATSVTIHSAYEIEEVFGGGNGYGFLPDGTKNPGANVGYEAYPEDYDPPASTAEYRTENYGYGSGKASVNIYNGRIHRVFGGSNTKGNVRVTAVTILEKMDEDCSFVIDEAYGGGKSAPMDAEAKLLMSCIPGLKEVYGGAQDADIINDVVLNISNGTFDRVFGGNNKSGSIHGTITVNIEETGCKPLIIGQLYGGGNLAPYTAPEGQPGPTVNVKAFTSIGEIYGGGYGAGADVTGDTYVNINEVILSKDETHQTEDYSIKPFIDTAHPDNEYENVELSDGTKYKLWYRPVKNAGTENAVPAMGVIGNVFGGGNEAAVNGSTHVNIGNKATETIVTLNNLSKDVKGVDIRGDVYGGGNKANVTGDTNVKVGKE